MRTQQITRMDLDNGEFAPEDEYMGDVDNNLTGNYDFEGELFSTVDNTEIDPEFTYPSDDTEIVNDQSFNPEFGSPPSQWDNNPFSYVKPSRSKLTINLRKPVREPPLSRSAPILPTTAPGEVLGSYLELTDKTKYKLSHQAAPNIFNSSIQKTSGQSPFVSVNLNSSKLVKRNIDKTMADEEDTLPSTTSTGQKIQSVRTGLSNSLTTDTNGHTTTTNRVQRTQIVDSIHDVRPSRTSRTPIIIKKPLENKPDLFSIDMDIAPGYQDDQVLAETVVQESILHTVKSRIMSLKESDLSQPQPSGKLDPSRPTDISMENIQLSSHINAACDLGRAIRERFFQGIESEPSILNHSTPTTTSASSTTLPPGRGLKIPNLEIVPRAFNMNNLREAVPQRYEPVCMFAASGTCEGMMSWKYQDKKYPIKQRNQECSGLNNSRSPSQPRGRPLAEKPFPLRRFFLPSEEKYIATELRKGKSRKEIMATFPPGPCVLCNRYATEQMTNAQKGQIDCEEIWPIQDHGNIFNEPGEYIQEVMLSSGFDYCGVSKPIVKHDRQFYVLGHYYVWIDKDTQDSLPDSSYGSDSTNVVDTLTTLIPAENSYIGSKPPDNLIQYACDTLKCDNVSVITVNGWLEIEDIIYKNTSKDPYVNAVNEVFIR